MVMREGLEVAVTVGSIYVMEEKHFIEWVELYHNKLVGKELDPSGEKVATVIFEVEADEA